MGKENMTSNIAGLTFAYSGDSILLLQKRRESHLNPFSSVEEMRLMPYILFAKGKQKGFALHKKEFQ